VHFMLYPLSTFAQLLALIERLSIAMLSTCPVSIARQANCRQLPMSFSAGAGPGIGAQQIAAVQDLQFDILEAQ
jgi:hypothetical protein